MLKTDNISKKYNSGLLFRKEHVVFDNLTIELRAGKTCGLMGSSGSGKSTLGRVIAGLESPSSGHVYYKGTILDNMDRKMHNGFRRNVQVMFQDPVGSLNPQKKIIKSMNEVLGLLGMNDAEKAMVIKGMLKRIGLSERLLYRYPSQLSGGENQRLALARIFLLEPEFIILDEPTSALDVSVQAQILHLLKQFQADEGTGYLFISHDERVIRFMSDKAFLLENGKISTL
ncbi:dipeptide/oligopeptide/nickel ABC transporter ATP-binding protein [uncultured Methanolobus sp.]|uniref:ABC transporter ATP-binding protein n=1 Tax=uncultured Methanolobus sp. TaxID=218300 RepID=UPI002AAB38C2|nr:dipeptide/oligopeptide/nickel ABC transporter ATP-binding protein [uncultured Methanolobus sp.]